MKIAVTGATGFIGHYVVAELLQQNHTVIALGRDFAKAEQKSWFKKVIFRPFYLENPEGFKELSRPDHLIHLAWQGLPNYDSPIHFENGQKSFQFLKKLIEEGLKHLTVAGTCFEYGLQEGCLTPQHPCQPVTAYGKAKLQLYQDLCQLQQKHPFSLKWARFFYLHGEGQSSGSLFPALQRAIDRGDPSFPLVSPLVKRDYLSVEEASSRLVQLALSNQEKALVNICSGKAVSLVSLAQTYLDRQNSSLQLIPYSYPHPPYESLCFYGAISGSFG